MGLKINEIFYSLQGESSYAGIPCVFIRLSGCNLRCSYCDTRYAYEEGEERSISEILEEVKKFKCKLVEVTGGEPLLQAETPLLVEALLRKGYRVLVETNGSMDIDLVSRKCMRIMDIKCPSSGMSHANRFENLDRLSPLDELKFVIGDRQDFEYAKRLIEEKDLNSEREGKIHFAPVFGKLKPSELASWILENRLPVRLQLQIHKIIWSPEKRGV